MTLKSQPNRFIHPVTLWTEPLQKDEEGQELKLHYKSTQAPLYGSIDALQMGYYSDGSDSGPASPTLLFFLSANVNLSSIKQHVDFDGNKWTDLSTINEVEGHSDDNLLFCLCNLSQSASSTIKHRQPLRDYNTSN